jgi:hypothetical protein
MAVWSINIVPGEGPGDPVSFVCELQPNAPPNTIFAEVRDKTTSGDAVTWSNETGDPHQIAIPAGKSGSAFLSEEIPPDHSSRPTYLCVAPASGNQIVYSCKLHPGEQGVITLTNVAPATS